MVVLQGEPVAVTTITGRAMRSPEGRVKNAEISAPIRDAIDARLGIQMNLQARCTQM
jgi:hypothetical protein